MRDCPFTPALVFETVTFARNEAIFRTLRVPVGVIGFAEQPLKEQGENDFMRHQGLILCEMVRRDTFRVLRTITFAHNEAVFRTSEALEGVIDNLRAL